jgi:hypothetical protein
MSCRSEWQISPKLGSKLSSPLPCTVEEVWTCDFCEKVTIRLVRYGAYLPDSEVGDMLAREPIGITVLWPSRPPRELDATVPEAIRSLFREAGVCEGAHAYRGAAGLLRATVEEICRDKGATGSTLYKRIEKLKDDGLSEEIVEDFHEARMLGNDSLHDGLEYSREEVVDVAELIEEAVVIMYVEPAERAAMRERRKERRRAMGQQ